MFVKQFMRLWRISSKKIAPLYHSIKAHCNAVPLYFEKPKKIFPFSPDNGGCRRELVCPDNAETHFRRLKEPRNAFSLRRCSLFSPPFTVTLFPLGYLIFYHYSTPNAKTQAFASNLFQEKICHFVFFQGACKHGRIENSFFKKIGKHDVFNVSKIKIIPA